MFTFGHVVILFLTLVSPLSCFTIQNALTYHKQPVTLSKIAKHGTRAIHHQPRVVQRGIPKSSTKMVNVDSYGAKGDGSDDSKAFMQAWKVVCGSKDSAVLLVPKNKVYHLNPVTFPGPCKSPLTTVQIEGTIKASTKKSDYKNDLRHWIVFEDVNNFKVQGGGTINGNGKIWWDTSCKVNKKLPCKEGPTAVTFYGCNNLEVTGIRIKNSQQMQLSFQKCVNVRASNLLVVAPGHSPNTDGIHVTETQNIQILNSVIRTGDDCISIVSGSKNVKAMGITCGPGHGISIGSLGKDKSTDTVSDVFVDGAKITGTTNGVRIKTWQGGSGYARNIVFQNIVMKNVTNPIIVDQNYCDQDEPCSEQGSAVAIENVTYKNIKGTSASEVATKFDCSKSSPCTGIVMQDVVLTEEATDGNSAAKALCKNVKMTKKGRVFPNCP